MVIHSKGHGPFACLGSKGLKGSLRGPWLQRHKMSKVLKVPKVLTRQVLEIKALRVKGFKTYGNTS